MYQGLYIWVYVNKVLKIIKKEKKYTKFFDKNSMKQSLIDKKLQYACTYFKIAF